MSHPLTDNDSFDVAVVTPDILDTTYPAVVTQGQQSLANRTKYIQNTLSGASGATDVLNNTNTGVFDALAGNVLVPLNARSSIIYGLAYSLLSTIRYVRQYMWAGSQGSRVMAVPVDPTKEGDGAGNYQPPGTAIIGGGPFYNTSATASRWWWYQLATPTAAPELYWHIPGLPPQGTILTFSLAVKGAGSHAGLPTTMPTLSLYKQLSGGATSQIGATITDTSANTSQYQTEHFLQATNLSEPLVANTTYFFKFTGEAGTNKLPQLQLFECNIGIGP